MHCSGMIDSAPWTQRSLVRCTELWEKRHRIPRSNLPFYFRFSTQPSQNQNTPQHPCFSSSRDTADIDKDEIYLRPVQKKKKKKKAWYSWAQPTWGGDVICSQSEWAVEPRHRGPTGAPLFSSSCQSCLDKWMEEWMKSLTRSGPLVPGGGWGKRQVLEARFHMLAFKWKLWVAISYHHASLAARDFQEVRLRTLIPHVGLSAWHVFSMLARVSPHKCSDMDRKIRNGVRKWLYP